jgi:putative tryptophan/tyrosine transport system substrate-binding protein
MHRPKLLSGLLRRRSGRRGFLLGVAGLVEAPYLARAQRDTRPAIGWLHSASPDSTARNLQVFRAALSARGLREEDNVTVHYRWAENRYERLPALVAELVERVSVLVVMGAADGPRAAKRATASVPIVFGIGSDPIAAGLVGSLNPQSGNITGATFFSSPLGPKRLELLREMLPEARQVGVLANPHNLNAAPDIASMEAAAPRLGFTLRSLSASKPSDLDPAFAAAARDGVGAVVVMTDALFNSQIDLIVATAARHALPASYFLREFVTAGGLMSYGASISDMYRQVGDYAARIVHGVKPSDLPVLQPSKFELAINGATARALGLAVPPALLVLADEVIE